MCVRGTVFRVCLLKGKDNSVFDLVEVYDGKVWSNIDDSDDSVTLEPGQCALIRKTDSQEEKAKYVLEEDINDKFIEETGLNISLENVENGEQGALKLSLDNVPIETLSRLETIIDEGTPLAVEKEEITQVKETKIEETNNSEDDTQTASQPVLKETKVVEEDDEPKSHTHRTTNVVTKAATCQETGLYNVVCSECGEVISKDNILAIDHSAHVGKEQIEDEDETCSSTYRTNIYKCPACKEIISYDNNNPSMHIDFNGDENCDYCGNPIVGLNSLVGLYVSQSNPKTPIGIDNIGEDLANNATIEDGYIVTTLNIDAEFKSVDRVAADGVECGITIAISCYNKDYDSNSLDKWSIKSNSKAGFEESIVEYIKGITGLTNKLDEIHDALNN